MLVSSSATSDDFEERTDLLSVGAGKSRSEARYILDGLAAETSTEVAYLC